ncbi:MAG: EamA family transporter [Rickettsiales bacterium]|nr:EamA family transporter [Rickettsiales bacterium]
MSVKNYLLVLIVTFIWGFNFVFAKIALDYFEPFTLLALRYLVIAILLIPFYRKPPISFLNIILLSFIFSIMHLGAMFYGLKLGLNASIGVVILQTHVPFLLLLGVIFFNEKIGIRSIIGLFLSFIGSMILMNAPNSIEHKMGFWLMLISAFSVAFYGAIIKKLGKIDIVALIAWIAFISSPFMIIISLILEDGHNQLMNDISINIIFAFLYITIGSAIIGHSLWAYLLSHNPISSIAPITLLIPVIGVLGGAIILNEQIMLNMILGSILVIIGAGILIIRRPYIVESEVDL